MTSHAFVCGWQEGAQDWFQIRGPVTEKSHLASAGDWCEEIPGLLYLTITISLNLSTPGRLASSSFCVARNLDWKEEKPGQILKNQVSPLVP